MPASWKIHYPPDILITVNPPEFTDWPALHRLLTECFAYMDDRIDPPSSLTRMTHRTLQQKAAEETLVIAHYGPELIACGFLRLEPAAVYLGKLAVDHRFRRRGLLRAMVSIAEDIARAQSRHALVLETRIELTENHATFASLGFKKTAENAHDGYDRPTSITMSREVKGKHPVKTAVRLL